MDKGYHVFIQSRDGDCNMVKYPMSWLMYVDDCHLTIMDEDGKEYIDMGLHPPTCFVETVIPLSEVITFYLENAPKPEQKTYLYTDEETSTQGLIDKMLKETENDRF
jgi:hypothetical protein